MTALRQQLEGVGREWGDWLDSRRCPTGSFVCGIQQELDCDSAEENDTALNGVVFFCCKYDDEQW